jgi:hypothetical protein
MAVRAATPGIASRSEQRRKIAVSSEARGQASDLDLTAPPARGVFTIYLYSSWSPFWAGGGRATIGCHI